MLSVLAFSIQINLLLAIFNLIPVYPLDGSNIMLGVLKGRWLELYEKHLPYGMYVILALVFTGLLSRIMQPVLNLALMLISMMISAF